MKTAQRIIGQIDNELSVFPEVTYIKYNKQYIKETISIYKLKTFPYNFQQELSMRHLNVDYCIICIFGENYDEFEHIFNEFGSHKILQGKNHMRLILYDQNYINKSFSKNQIPKIDKLIQIFHYKMQKKRVEMFQEQDDVLKETNNFNHIYKNQEKCWKNRNLIKSEQEKEREN